MFDLFRRLSWGLDRFKQKHPKALDYISICIAVALCLYMLISQIIKVTGG